MIPAILGTIIFVYGGSVFIQGARHEVLSTLISVMLLGHWLEMKAVAKARGALDALAALLPTW